MILKNYFTDEKIIKLLCKDRANAANKRHEVHMLRNLSLHSNTNRIKIKDTHLEFKFLQSIFPHRRSWLKLKQSERRLAKDAVTINKQRLFKTYKITKFNIEVNDFEIPDWYSKLTNFVGEIQQLVFNQGSSDSIISRPKIKGIKKDVKNGTITYRPIALYDITSKIICSITAKYFTHYFDPIFHDCSFAFRGKNTNNHIPTHHDCIAKIKEYRTINPKLWVAECDIQKFFDTVQHHHVKSVFERLRLSIEAKNSERIDPKAVEIFYSFLGSFSFQENIIPLNGDTSYFSSNNLAFGQFGWAANELREAFGETYIESFKLGVPQGNAISCFVANLILHDVDDVMVSLHPRPFYIRYCDDMILMHKDHDVCFYSLNSYMEAVQNSFLLYHNPIEVNNYKEKKISKTFWEQKSKKPFFWGDKHIHPANVPWISFVGYQLNFYGRIRVRKSTIQKEVRKQVSETQKVLKALGKLNHTIKIDSRHARLPQRHITFRLLQKLISMSVGRIKIHTHRYPLEQGLCWTNGFKMLENNNITSRQLRYLDTRRNMQLMRVRREIAKINNKSKGSQYPDNLKEIYYGSAFGYHNFIKYKRPK
ncbi:reverse transcriptase domain-containing protein [Pedobacter mucosus]|uniref:reverse transcriptase domain-containing protein n=1 Tax=Pedobacter mucosus TaxID=2895286 RepID=UPI001EE47983|nr:reverse transcriptase domain-containing protein [Pedobacter mucosus]UKT62723.1 hypothetical protein LOK61_13230 [Pedobacter mucosus]